MIIVEGDSAVVESLLTLLGAASGLTLTVDHDQVAAEPTNSPPRSARLRAALEEMIASTPQVARINTTVGRGVHLGFFGPTQQLNVRNILGIERDAPDIGVVVAIHEIWETYQAWRPGGQQRGQYGPAHASALHLEGEIGLQLTGRPGARVAAANISSPQAPAYVLDLQDRFLTLTARPQSEVDTHGLFQANVRNRARLGTIDIDVPKAGSGSTRSCSTAPSHC